LHCNKQAACHFSKWNFVDFLHCIQDITDEMKVCAEKLMLQFNAEIAATHKNKARPRLKPALLATGAQQLLHASRITTRHVVSRIRNGQRFGPLLRCRARSICR
jgi:hypothetical protein